MKTLINRISRSLAIASLLVAGIVLLGCASPQATNAPEKQHSFANGVCVLLCFYQYEEADSNTGSTVDQDQTQTATLPINATAGDTNSSVEDN